MDEPSLRSATSADADAILTLAVAFYAEDGFSTPIDQLRTNLLHLLADVTAHIEVVPSEQGLIAFAITTTRFGLESGLIAELEDLYVVPEARRRGIADALIEDSAAWARERGCTHLEVVLAPNGQDISHLHRYYLARAFTDDGRQLIARPL